MITTASLCNLFTDLVPVLQKVQDVVIPGGGGGGVDC